MSLSPGDRVDRYEVIELLGSGGMGEVYRARDPKLARDVALKILRVDRHVGTEGAQRVLREARAAAMLSHANVLAVYDVGDVQEPEPLRGLAYIAMELVVGRSLKAYIEEGTVPLERRIGWLRDVASALGAAHKAGVVHRDVKPENIMIRIDGVVKVLDFGIARRAAATIDVWSSTEGHALMTSGSEKPGSNLPTLTGQGAIVGTPFYMAPEQLRGEALDARADQFAWGVVAYWLLSGTAPWPGGPVSLAVLSQILTLEPAAPDTLNTLIPAGISRAVMRALEKKREMRFASMAELIEALDAPAPKAMSTGSVEAPKGEAPAARPAKPATKRRAPLVAIAVAVSIASAAGATLMALRTRAPRASPDGSVVSAMAPIGACTSNAACVHEHGGAAWRCHSQRHVCVEIASTDCTVHAEAHDAEAEDVVWIGGMFPVHGVPDFRSESRAAEIARKDFAAVLGPSAARAGPLHARPIGLVICDETSDALRAARHLAEDVEVPAVVGFRSTTSALSTIPTVFLPNRVLSFATISQAPEITRIPVPPDEPRLVWRSTLNRLDLAIALAHFISEALEPKVRAESGGIGDRPLKVAAVWPTLASHDFVESLFDTLHYNGQSALANEANFRQFVLERDAGADNDDQLIESLLAFSPQVIVYAENAFCSRVLAPLEARWSRSRGTRPIYLTGSGLTEGAIAFAGRDASKRHRVFSTTNLSSTPTNAKLVLRYNLEFPHEPIARTGAPQPSYDAFYTLAYATYALGAAAVTGPALSRAIERLLPPGRRIDVGPAQVFEGFEALRGRGRIDLNGAIGSLDFDPATGEAPIDYSIVCAGVDDSGNASASVDSGLVYDARAKKMVGVLRCP